MNSSHGPRRTNSQEGLPRPSESLRRKLSQGRAPALAVDANEEAKTETQPLTVSDDDVKKDDEKAVLVVTQADKATDQVTEVRRVGSVGMSPRSMLGSSLRLTRPRCNNVRPAAPETHSLKRLEELMASYLSESPEDIAQFISNHVEYTLARSAENMDGYGAYQATAYSVRDRLIEFWNDTQKHFRMTKTKMVYYLSIEYLLGRSLQNAINNVELENNYTVALKEIGFLLEDLYGEESDAALGNGGLGRLAACFLDSLATMDLPAWGYGIRYRYGIFKQSLRNGDQIEQPDYWLMRGNPWEIVRNEITYPVRFFGQVSSVLDKRGNLEFTWEGGSVVTAVAHDTPIPGYGTLNTINLRLWSSRPTSEIDFERFNKGDYYEAVKARQDSERITSVLYPNDATYEGRELRLKQQYFFASASLQDILCNFKKNFGNDLSMFAHKNAIQLNDTHPAVSVAELMRLLLDQERIDWDQAWAITTATFAFTNHTVLPEALEEWPVPMFENLLPRLIQIIYEINQRFLDLVDEKWPSNNERKAQLSIIKEGNPKKVRMAHLAIIGSHSINGVAEIHTGILKSIIFASFYELWPDKFTNMTNGVTPRRWIHNVNRPLSALLTRQLGDDLWITNLENVKELRNFADDATLQHEFAKTKLSAKTKLKKLISKLTDGNLKVDPNALFDVHVKRIHEYKRQLLNILGTIYRYLQLKQLSKEERKQCVPRVVIFGGKAAPSYVAAKAIIKLIACVADVVNRDVHIDNKLKIVFIPNYNVSLAEVIIPASDISQHISTAGLEASGTSNMKFAMNGGLIVGTLDGANIEMAEEIGMENMFIFGLKAEEVPLARKYPVPIDERLHEVMNAIWENRFADEETTRAHFVPLLNPIAQGNDYYCVARDFPAYLETQKLVDDKWKDQAKWRKMALMTIAGTGKFSSDRTIGEYATEIWHVSVRLSHY